MCWLATFCSVYDLWFGVAALELVSCNRWVFKLTTGTVYYSLRIVFVGALCWQLLCGCNLILPVVDYCLGIGKLQSM